MATTTTDGTPADLSLKARLAQFTKTTIFLTLYMGSCAFNFGYDVGNFGGVQGMQSTSKGEEKKGERKNSSKTCCLLVTWVAVDGVGRRPLVLGEGACTAAFLLLVGALSTGPEPTRATRAATVAALMLFSASHSLSWAPIAYVTVSEAAASSVKEKTNLLAGVVSILAIFVISFTILYLMTSFAIIYLMSALGGKVGYVSGAINVVIVVVAWFLIPELKGRSLDEVDALFISGVPVRKFKGTRVAAPSIDGGGVASAAGQMTSLATDEKEAEVRVVHKEDRQV